MSVLLFLCPPLKCSLKYIQIKFSFLKENWYKQWGPIPVGVELSRGTIMLQTPAPLDWHSRWSCTDLTGRSLLEWFLVLGMKPRRTRRCWDLTDLGRPQSSPSLPHHITSETWKEFSIQAVGPSCEETRNDVRVSCMKCPWQNISSGQTRLKCKREDDSRPINNQNREPLPPYAATHVTAVKH